MTGIAHAQRASTTSGGTGTLDPFVRTLVIGLVAFLTVVDLFATQAILPSLATHYRVSPAAMGFAVNASTIGMAIAGIAVAYIGRRIDRRIGLLASLVALAVPTALLALAPDLTTFTALRVVQGLCMSTAFALMLSYLGEACTVAEAGSAFAAYITGNVASNLIGRLMSAALADHLGLAGNFYVFAALNAAGGLLVYFYVGRSAPIAHSTSERPAWSILREHFRNRSLYAAFAIGFCILFAFIGTFTFVNFVLVREPLSLSRMALGFVYFVFLPSVFTTPLAGRLVQRVGTRRTLWASLGVAAAGLPLLLATHLGAVLAGLALVGVGTFFAQATATGFVGRAATTDRGSASGVYLACYFLGGLVGTALLGQAFDRLGWAATVGGVGVALAVAAALALRLADPSHDGAAREAPIAAGAP